MRSCARADVAVHSESVKRRSRFIGMLVSLAYLVKMCAGQADMGQQHDIDHAMWKIFVFPLDTKLFLRAQANGMASTHTL
jgi:nitrate reductase beta subunit